jgi:hypothetical protein
MANFNKMICKRRSNRCAILTRHDAVGTAHDDAEHHPAMAVAA